MARTPSQREIAAFIVGHGITDFVSGGRLSKIERDALWKVLKKLGPAAVTTTGRLAGTTAAGVTRALPAVARGVRFVTMRHPYIAAAVVTYEVVKNREQIEQLAREGWEVISDTAEAMAPIVQTEFERLMTEGPRPSPGMGLPPGFPKKRKSKYNRAMSSAMRAVKASSKGGKKGTLSSPKATFSTVSKVVSKVNRGLKVTTKGISGIAARAARKILGKKKKKSKKGKATFTYRKN